MTFRRSSGSLHSLHIFFGVDAVVFCEGGASLSFDAATIPELGSPTLDTFYWSKMCEYTNVARRLHFKSVGSKETIQAIASDAEQQNIDTIVVCCDADYDVLLGRFKRTRRTAVTLGYSWESDVVSFFSVKNIVSNLVDFNIRTEIITQIYEHFNNIKSQLVRWVEIDVSLVGRGRLALFDRDKPLASIEASSPSTLRTDALARRLAAAGYSRKPRRLAVISEADVMSRCFGKLISKTVYKIVMMQIEPYINSKISYDLFMRMAISETINSLKNCTMPALDAHVLSQRAAFS